MIRNDHMELFHIFHYFILYYQKWLRLFLLFNHLSFSLYTSKHRKIFWTRYKFFYVFGLFIFLWSFFVIVRFSFCFRLPGWFFNFTGVTLLEISFNKLWTGVWFSFHFSLAFLIAFENSSCGWSKVLKIETLKNCFVSLIKPRIELFEFTNEYEYLQCNSTFLYTTRYLLFWWFYYKNTYINRFCKCDSLFIGGV